MAHNVSVSRRVQREAPEPLWVGKGYGKVARQRLHLPGLAQGKEEKGETDCPSRPEMQAKSR